MLTRGKKIVNLVKKLDENNTTVTIDCEKRNTIKKSKDNHSISKDKKVYEFSEEDPWVDFKKWKVWKEQNPRTLVTDNADTSKENENCGLASPSLSSSTSWVPPTENNTDSTLSFMGFENEAEDIENIIIGNEITRNMSQISSVTLPLQNKKEGNDNNKKINNINIHQISKRFATDIANVGHKVELSRRRERIWDKRDRCPYCNKDLTNFSRHLFRNHASEESVDKILSIPKGNSKRKLFIDILRKQGNFSVYSQNIIRPVQRPSSFEVQKDVMFLPCKFCKGLYKKESLRRHVKTCNFNSDNNNINNTVRYASEGQTLLAFTESRRSFLSRLRLVTEVFDTMHADRISLTAKKDPLVCQYAEDLLRKYKRPHIKNLVSNKMRELGRLLVVLEDVYQINSMLEVLKPEHFDKVVSAARNVSGYNEATKNFRAPSLALHFRTILLAICSTANTLLLKKHPIIPVADYERQLKDIKNFKQIVQNNWKFEMGSLALKDLTEKHSINPQKLPITEDILLFNNYCFKIADEAACNLKNNLQNAVALKKLSEAVLALTISLNRKRVGDVQYITVERYKYATKEQEDCFSVLTDFEKELTRNFKRVINIGKGSKAVPILFPKKIQNYIELMLLSRDVSSIIPDENPFLFALSGSSSKWIDGSSTLRRFADACGAKNPQTITSSRLRKQIATVLQILSLNEVEMEQVATFMGHTKKTHEEFYRLPQEVFQTSKIAKLLLMLMEKGISKQDQGKRIEEIDVQLNTWHTRETDVETEAGSTSLVNKNISVSTTPTIIKQSINKQKSSSIERDEANISHDITINSNSSDEDSVCLETTKNYSRRNLKTNVGTRGSWNSKQKSIMLKYFRNHIKNKISPKKHECLNLKEKHTDLFDQKTWIQIKVFVYNLYRNK